MILFPIAVKCNDDSVVLELLSSLGTNFDCASKGEINKVLSLDVHQDRIIFANPTKHPHHIKHAKENGVNLMTFDNEAELQKIKKLYPNAKYALEKMASVSLILQCVLDFQDGDPHQIRCEECTGENGC